MLRAFWIAYESSSVSDPFAPNLASVTVYVAAHTAWQATATRTVRHFLIMTSFSYQSMRNTFIL